MSIAIDSQSRVLPRKLAAASLYAVSRLVTADPLGVLVARQRERMARRDGRIENGVAPIVVFMVLIAVLAVLAAAISVAVLIFCSQKGMNFEWYVKTSWFEVKVACRK